MNSNQVTSFEFFSRDYENTGELLLAPRHMVAALGMEQDIKIHGPGIMTLCGDDQTYRYIYDTGQLVVSAILLKCYGYASAIVSMYTLPMYRRKGYATKLFRQVEKDFHSVAFTTKLNSEGWAFAERVAPQRIPKGMWPVSP